MSRLKTLVVDDDLDGRERVCALLASVPGVVLTGTAGDCAGVQSVLANERPDLVVLEAVLPDGDPFDLLARLDAATAPIVAFVTAHPQFAHRAFAVDAVDYLLKPVDARDLVCLVDRARRRARLPQARATETWTPVAPDTRAEEPPPGPIGAAAFGTDLWVRHRGTHQVRVPVSEIDWIEAQDDYACIRANGREHLLRGSLDRIMQILDPSQFFRIHRSIVVRIDRVQEVRRKRVGVREAVLRDGTVLPVGRVHARNLGWREQGAHARAGKVGR